ncbi:MAG: hypothetical protein AAGF11_01910 [Myxococcota bacterium]
MPRARYRLAFSLALLACACATSCATSEALGPQQARFPAGQRVTRSGALTLEMSEARYDLRELSVKVSLTNAGDAPLLVERKGVLLAYDELEFPVAEASAPELTESTALAPGSSTELELRFVIEQPLLEAATLHLLSIRRDDDQWLDPLRIAVPPPAAFVQAAAQPDAE